MPFSKLTGDEFSQRIGSWLTQSGPDSDVVVSCRVRLARNVAGYPFMVRLKEQRAAELSRTLRHALELALAGGGERIWVDIPQASPLERLLLRERHLVSRDHAPIEKPDRGQEGRAVAFDSGETVAVMVNEEDHLRLQGLAGGFDLDLARERVTRVDQSLEGQVDFAFSERLGYLTACPTNVGTGMRASVMLHLPALGLVRSELEKVFSAAQRTGLAVRGMYGEGSRAAGDFYQLSNQVTLGREESALVDDLQALVPCVIDFERKVREALLESRRDPLRDRVMHSIGMLSNARALPTEVALQHLSNLRLGASLSLMDDLTPGDVDALAVRIQKGHVQACFGEPEDSELLDASERDRLRASFLRQHLKKDPS